MNMEDVAGVATLEDIMEEVVGDIKDEFDTDEEVDYIKISPNNYILEGKTLLNDVCRIIGKIPVTLTMSAVKLTL